MKHLNLEDQLKTSSKKLKDIDFALNEASIVAMYLIKKE